MASEGVKNATLRWMEDFTIENATEERFDHTTGWINGTAWEPELADDSVHPLIKKIGAVFMVVAIPSNTAILLITGCRFWRETKFRSMHLFSCNLALADIFVSTLSLPAQAGWIPISPWKREEEACRTFAFFRIFGKYLANFTIISISVDRAWTALTPIHGGGETSKKAIVMVLLAWVASIASSTPEAILYHIHSYPYAPWQKECTNLGSFSSKGEEKAYFAIQTVLLCILPFIVIVVCYTCIFWKMGRRQAGAIHCPRADVLARAKRRTAVVYILIVLTFFISWTPPVVVKLWLWICPASAFTVDPEVWEVLLLFENTSACFHPMISGLLQLQRNLIC